MDVAAIVRTYWAAAEARDWATFGSLLADDVVYELPQTRERIRGRPDYVQFNREYPSDWQLRIERVVGTGDHGASWTSFEVGGATLPALCFFDLNAAGLIARITDFWPEPYEPPPGREQLTERY